MRLRSKIVTFLLITMLSTSSILAHLDSRRVHREIKQLQREASEISTKVNRNVVDVRLFIDMLEKTVGLTDTQMDILTKSIFVVAKALYDIAPNVEPRPDFTALKDANVSVSNIFKGSQGSGVIIKNIDGVSLILTAEHVIDNSKFILIDHDSGRYAATVLATDKVRDLALLKVHQEVGTALPIAEETAELGERIYSISSPLNLIGIAIDGIFSGSDSTDGRETHLVTLDTLFGSSGGMVTNNKGELIGIISKVVMYPATVHFKGKEKKEEIPATKKKKKEEELEASTYYTTTFNIMITLEDIKFFLLGLVK